MVVLIWEFISCFCKVEKGYRGWESECFVFEERKLFIEWVYLGVRMKLGEEFIWFECKGRINLLFWWKVFVMLVDVWSWNC